MALSCWATCAALPGGKIYLSSCLPDSTILTILDARAQFPDSSLADLYNPLTMPPKLLKAHEALDKAVDKLYRKEGFKSDTERVACLFELNRGLTSLVIEEPRKSKRIAKS